MSVKIFQFLLVFGLIASPFSISHADDTAGSTGNAETSADGTVVVPSAGGGNETEAEEEEEPECD